MSLRNVSYELLLLLTSDRHGLFNRVNDKFAGTSWKKWEGKILKNVKHGGPILRTTTYRYTSQNTGFGMVKAYL